MRPSVVVAVGLVGLAACAAADVPGAAEWFTWTKATDSAVFGTRSRHGAVASEGTLWVFGGAAPAAFLDDVWRSTDGASWTSASSQAPFGDRVDAATASLGDVLWVIGGESPSAAVDDVWWSRDGEAWNRTAATTGTRVRAMVVKDDELFVLGGQGDPSVRRSRDGGSWTLVTADAEPLRGRQHYAATVHDGRIWIAAGIGTAEAASAWREDVWSSPDGVTWTQATGAAEFPHRQRAALVSGGGLLWLVGGDDRTDTWISADGAVWSLAEDSAAWSRRTAAAVVEDQGIIWLIGGLGPEGGALADVWWAPTSRFTTP